MQQIKNDTGSGVSTVNEKTCVKCGEAKPQADFYARMARCKSCHIAIVRSYRQNNKGKISEQKRAYYKANGKDRLEYQRAYQQTETGKESLRRAKQARRARNSGAAGFHDFKFALEVYGHRCALCGDAESKLTVGHIIPLSRGGSNWQWNIRPECNSCNCSKQYRMDEELSANWWADRPDGSEWPTQI